MRNNTTLEDFGKRAVRHGEILLVPIAELPEGAEETFKGKEYIVGHSETGHHHVAYGNIGVFTLGERTFLKIESKSRIEHLKTFERHPTQPLFKGLYEVTVKRAYDYFKKRMENVRD